MSLIQYIIVRSDLIKNLKWNLGAVIAQTCHAVTAINHLSQEDPETQEYLKNLDSMHKCVLQVETEEKLVELSKKLEENDIKHKLWIEQPENFPTCIAVKPCNKEVVHPFLKTLKLYR